MIERIEAFWVNGPGVQTAGLDVDFSWAFDLGAGRMELGASYNSVLSYDVDAYIKNGAQVAASYDALGKLNFDNPTLPLPDLRSRYSVEYSTGSHSILWYSNLIGGYEDQRESSQKDAAAFAVDIDQHLTHDVHYSWSFAGAKGTLTASMINLLDEAPPRGTLELGYDPYTHNAFGRMIKVGVRYSVF